MNVRSLYNLSELSKEMFQNRTKNYKRQNVSHLNIKKLRLEETSSSIKFNYDVNTPFCEFEKCSQGKG